MVNKFLIFLTVLLIFSSSTSCCTKNPSFGNNKVSVSNNILRSSAAIIVQTPFGSSIVGSGTFVDADFGKVLVTAQHVASIQDRLLGQLQACSVIDLSDCVPLGRNYLSDESEALGSDWAVYMLGEFPDNTRSAKVSQRLPSVGEEIYVSGVPQGHVPWISQGHVAYVWSEQGHTLFGLDAFAFFGSSGGGVYDKRGRLIGITSAISASQWGPIEDKVFVAPIANISFLTN